MKVVAFLCVYDDWEYLDATIEAIKRWPWRLYLIEGAWKSSMRFGAPPRSGRETMEIIQRHVDGGRVVLVQGNEDTEVAQRQLGLELAKKDGADWCFLLDADEVHTDSALKSTFQILAAHQKNRETFGFRLNSFNFFNSFWEYFDGNYPRIYRVTPESRFVHANDVEWPDFGKPCWGEHVLSFPPVLRFFHYSYVRRNAAHFFLKMNFFGAENPEFLVSERLKYDFKDGLYRRPNDQVIRPFRGEHPVWIRKHPYYVS